MTRTEILKASIKSSARQLNRENITPLLDSKSMVCSIAERKAYALKNILDNMPLHIDSDELIVGTRTFYKIEKKIEEDLQDIKQKNIVDVDTDDIPLNLNDTEDGIHIKSALPHYINEKDIKFFGDINQEFATSAQFTPNYSLLIEQGLDGLLANLYKSKPTSKIQKDYKNAILISYMGFRTLINRYQKYAVRQSKADRVETKRRIELMQIANCCQHIKHKKPRNFQEAAQLYWFAHLVSMIDSGNTINCGKIDEILGGYYKDNEKDQALIASLLKKFSNELDETEKNTHTKTLTLTGAITSEENGANMLTLAILDNFANLELTHPTISMYINANHGDRYFKKATKVSEKGINIVKYFNEYKFINDLKSNGISEMEAKRIDQNVLSHINDDFYVTGTSDLTQLLVQTLLELGSVDENGQPYDITSILNEYKINIKNDIAVKITNYFKIQTAVTNFATGTEKQLLDNLKDDAIAKNIVKPFMSPLPFVSGIVDGCLENALDVTWFGQKIKAYSYILDNPVTAINSLGAIKKHVFEDNTFTLMDIKKAIVGNFKGEEKMRKVLFSTQYWGNSMIEYDLLAKDVIEFANQVSTSMPLPNGAKIYPYTNQSEPVSAGKHLPATPDGRLKESPVLHSVLTRTASDALLAIEPQYQFGNFFTIDRSVTKEICVDLVKNYFKLGGHTFVPNTLDIKQLKEAQKKPEKYPNIMVYYNNQFVRFIDADNTTQDDIINLVKNGML